MAIDSGVVQDFIESIKPQEYGIVTRSSAVVSHIDEEGTVWVNVAGSTIATPTASTSSEVNTGDDVTVEFRNNKLYIAGNYSNPSAGTARVVDVETAAEVAYQAAEQAVNDAATAHDAAEAAQASANAAQTSADNALVSAQNASEYASRALGNLSTVQSVTETLNWITAHGTMTLTSDIALDPTHVYFVLDANGDYSVGGNTYSVVTEPDVANISTYYELSIDESLNNYVGTHLAVTSEGLWLLPDAGGNKVLIATGQGSTYTTAGTYIIGKVNNVDTVLAKFTATSATIGNTDSGNLLADINGIAVRDGLTELAIFSASGVTLGKAGEQRTHQSASGLAFVNENNYYVANIHTESPSPYYQELVIYNSTTTNQIVVGETISLTQDGRDGLIVDGANIYLTLAIDEDLYTAIDTLGWTSDVIV